ncbi:MAG: DUF3783 domain-containing protein [Oscillospiraceae bacterium]|nr:DUF3783 domain-containing protein [Oscillospiraceae bacterium]
MKARIHIEEKRLVMLYALEEEKLAKTLKLLKARELPARKVLPEQAGETLGYLAGYAGFEASGGPAPSDAPREECMVLAGLEERELHSFLDDLRRAGVEIPLKAVVTGPNRGWTFARLMGELQKEREAISRMAKKKK